MKKHVQPHIMCGLGDDAKYVLVSGDPGRVEKIAALFDQNPTLCYSICGAKRLVD